MFIFEDGYPKRATEVVLMTFGITYENNFFWTGSTFDSVNLNFSDLRQVYNIVNLVKSTLN